MRGLRAFIARRVENEADVEDILQEVFLRVHRRIGSVKHVGRLRPWLFQITRNAMIDHYRATGRRKETTFGSATEMEGGQPATAAEAPGIDADSATLRQELSACLDPLIQLLPPRYRDAIILADLEGVTHRAAAKRLGLSISAMKSRVQRGRKRIKFLLHDCCRIQLDRSGRIVEYEVRNQPCDLCDPRGPAPWHRARDA
jgi:RNA polymerase sigma-70 factor (ECF subfamily)